MSTVLILLFALTLLATETFKLEEVVTTVTPLEAKYEFESLAACEQKIQQLEAANKLTGLSCTAQ